MELDVLQILGGFVVGVVFGIVAVLLFNKLRSGSASAAGVKQEYDEYKNQVEQHFEETSKKFKNMTEQYQDLYEHLSVGATSLCRPDSVAAALADGGDTVKPKQIEVSDDSAAVNSKEVNTEAGQESEVVNAAEKEANDIASADKKESSKEAKDDVAVDLAEPATDNSGANGAKDKDSASEHSGDAKEK